MLKYILSRALKTPVNPYADDYAEVSTYVKSQSSKLQFRLKNNDLASMAAWGSLKSLSDASVNDELRKTLLSEIHKLDKEQILISRSLSLITYWLK